MQIYFIRMREKLVQKNYNVSKPNISRMLKKINYTRKRSFTTISLSNLEKWQEYSDKLVQLGTKKIIFLDI